MPEMRAETDRESVRKRIGGLVEKAIYPDDLMSSALPTDPPRTKPSLDARPGVDVSRGITRPPKRTRA